MKTSAKVITLSAALATGLGAVYAAAPSYAQDAENTETVAQLGPGGPVGARHGGPGGPGPMDLPMPKNSSQRSTPTAMAW